MHEPSDVFERVKPRGAPIAHSNQFVVYLNSLHCRDSGGENALAEAQACDPHFALIQVRSPLVGTIADCLCGTEPRNVILTGHAGDGKSTMAVELYKELSGQPLDQPLERPMQEREEITLSNGRLLSIVKDLSEWSDEDRSILLQEILKAERYFLLVSNTGTLLNLFCEYGDKHLAKSRTQTESALLKAISADQCYDLAFDGCHFGVLNLALLDNLSTARRIFARMLNGENWLVCADSSCHLHCPVYRNVRLMQEHQELITDRLFLAYRRMYSYGSRLTLRQLTAHLAYTITSGLDCQDVSELSKRADKPLISQFMFYNRFFGDDGLDPDIPALQLKGIKQVRRQGFGARPCPTWERRLWLLTQDQNTVLGVPFLEDEFSRLRHCGSGQAKHQDSTVSPDQARDLVRRMLYFLHDFAIGGDSFIRQFLASPSISEWWSWQSAEAGLSLDQGATLKHRVLHVLQEQFAGVRLPGSMSDEQRLYITLNRRKQDIRQSAQVVIAQVDFAAEFSLELAERRDEWSQTRKELRLVGLGRLDGIGMWLDLPFLDYVLMRHNGEAAAALQAAYVNRLEKLKSQLVMRGDRARSDDLLLVRLNTNYRFVRQVYALRGDRLEVANA